MFKAILNKSNKIKILIIWENLLILTVNFKILKKNKTKKIKAQWLQKKNKPKLKIMIMILKQNKNLKKWNLLLKNLKLLKKIQKILKWKTKKICNNNQMFYKNKVKALRVNPIKITIKKTFKKIKKTIKIKIWKVQLKSRKLKKQKKLKLQDNQEEKKLKLKMKIPISNHNHSIIELILNLLTKTNI